jgi:phosphatidyl-myo-inositol alpha-mannosyltransferase
MRIALVSPYLWSVPGGVNDHVANLGAELEKRGHEPWIMAPSGGVRLSGSEVPQPERFISGGVAMPVRSNGSTAHVNFSPLTPLRVRRIFEERRFDLVHAHEPCVPSVAASSVFLAGRPVVGTFHAAGERSLPYTLLSPFAGAIVDRLAGRIAVSESARQFVGRHFPGDYHIIPNGVVPEAYSPALQGAKIAGRVLFIGRPEPRKGLLVLLEALAHLRATHPWATLTVIGTDQEQLRALAGASQPSLDRCLPGVEARGRVSHEDKVKALSEAEVLVVPSLEGESFGIVLIEALAAGVPLVASDLGGYRSVLRGGELGMLVPPGDPVALARDMALLLTDGRRRQTLSDRGLLASREYAWSRVADLVLKVYEQALFQGRAPSDALPFARRNGKNGRHRPKTFTSAAGRRRKERSHG